MPGARYVRWVDNVFIEYSYTEDDHSTWASFVLAGPATQGELVRLWRRLGPEGLFVPEQVGLPPAVPLDRRESPFHELMDLHLTRAYPAHAMRWDDVLVRIESVARWEDPGGDLAL